jgi:hypothetical protein
MAQDQNKLDVYAISNEGVLLLEIIKRLEIGESGNGPATEDTLNLLLTELQSKNDRETVRDKYIVLVADTGYSIGDSLSRISSFDITTGTAVLIETFWFNHTTDLVVATVDINDLESLNADGLPTPGADTQIIAANGAIIMAFDADAVLVENDTATVITVAFGGMLGTAIKVLPNTSKVVEVSVPYIDSVTISDWVAGNIYITYSRSR